jgi:hypothetical protein
VKLPPDAEPAGTLNVDTGQYPKSATSHDPGGAAAYRRGEAPTLLTVRLTCRSSNFLW